MSMSVVYSYFYTFILKCFVMTTNLPQLPPFYVILAMGQMGQPPPIWGNPGHPELESEFPYY